MTPQDTGGNQYSSGKRQARTVFTSGQLTQLEQHFQQKNYLSPSEKADLARQLMLTENQVIL